RAVRPRQWLKNLLVAAAALAAGTLFHPAVLGRVAVAVVAFCLQAGAVYLVNDVLDADSDRRHPVKRLRPVASGALSTPTALAAAVTITGYGLWAFQVGSARGEPGWAQLSVAPFVLTVLRYAVDVDRGGAGAPEDVVLGDPALIVLGIAWVVLFAAAAGAA